MLRISPLMEKFSFSILLNIFNFSSKIKSLICIDKKLSGRRIMAQEEFSLKTAQDFLDYIAKWKNNGRIRLDSHLKRDRAERGVTTRDCEEILTSADLSSFLWPPEWNEKHQNHVMRVRGRDLDDKGMELVITIDFRNATVLVITAKPDTPDKF